MLQNRLFGRCSLSCEQSWKFDLRSIKISTSNVWHLFNFFCCCQTGQFVCVLFQFIHFPFWLLGRDHPFIHSSRCGPIMSIGEVGSLWLWLVNVTGTWTHSGHRLAGWLLCINGLSKQKYIRRTRRTRTIVHVGKVCERARTASNYRDWLESIHSSSSSSSASVHLAKQ